MSKHEPTTEMQHIKDKDSYEVSEKDFEGGSIYEVSDMHQNSRQNIYEPTGKEYIKHSTVEVERQTYLQKFTLFLRILPAILDHLSDIPVLYTLWHNGYEKLFWLGLSIDLMGGPIAAYQFYILGYKKGSIFLIFQPINIILYTFLAICNVNEKLTSFSKRVVAYCHESQALLESPLQVIFTVTLICHGILPAPWNKSFVIKNSFGNEINVTFFPTLSVILSLIAIIFSASATVNLLKNFKSNLKRTFSWIIFLLANIMFRLQVWIILSTFLVEFVAILILIIFLINLVTFIFTQSKVKVDPVLSSIYSVAFPITFMKSISHASKIEEELSFIKEVNKILASVGAVILIAALWIVYFIMPVLKYNPNIIVERDVLYYFMISTTVLGVSSIASTAFLSVPKMPEFVVRFSVTSIEGSPIKLKPNTSLARLGRCLTKMGKYGIRLVLLSAICYVIVMPYVMKRRQNPISFTFEVCGEDSNAVFQGYGYGAGQLSNESLRRCPFSLNLDKKYLGTNFELLTCMESRNDTKILLVDRAPATFLPSHLNKTQVILVSPKNNQSLDALKANVERLNRCKLNETNLKTE